MIRLSIRRQIIGIAIGLIVLMACASILSMLMARREGDRLEQLTTRYIPAYGNLARANIRSLNALWRFGAWSSTPSRRRLTKRVSQPTE
jgi:hypothetical protein